MTDTRTMTTDSPGRRWLEVALDTDLAPDSLAQIAAAATGLLAVVVDKDEAEGRAAAADDDYLELRAEYAGLEALHDAKQAKIEEALAAMKKSTSKLADQLREILEPVVVPPTPAEPEPVTDAPPLVDPAQVGASE